MRVQRVLEVPQRDERRSPRRRSPTLTGTRSPSPESPSPAKQDREGETDAPAPEHAERETRNMPTPGPAAANAPAAYDMEVDKLEEEFDGEETLSVSGSIKGAVGTSSMRARP